MKFTKWFLVVLAVVGLVATACGDDDDDAVLGGAESSGDDASDGSDDASDESDDQSDDASDESDGSDDAADEESSDEPDTTIAVEETTTTTATTTTVIAGTEDTVSVFDLEVGDCINTDQLAGSVSEVGSLDCAVAHDFEIYFAFDIADGAFPGEDAINAEAETQCLGDAFTSYVGIDYQSSTFYVQPLTPTVESWGAGDREVLCMLYATNDAGVTVAPYTGSAQGTGL